MILSTAHNARCDKYCIVWACWRRTREDKRARRSQGASKPESGCERKCKEKGKYSICGTFRSHKGAEVLRVLLACATHKRNVTFHRHFTACEMPVKREMSHGNGQRRRDTWGRDRYAITTSARKNALCPLCRISTFTGISQAVKCP